MRQTRQSENGIILVVSIVIIVMLMALSASYIILSNQNARLTSFSDCMLKAQYVAEAGIGDSFASLSGGGDGNVVGQVACGSYEVLVEDFAENGLYKKITARGYFEGKKAVYEVIITGALPSSYTGGSKAIIAGNRMGDPGYQMEFGGQQGAKCDKCNGKGFVDCPFCGGAGTFFCTVCGGDGSRTCTYWRCGGVGRYPCNRCGGDGIRNRRTCGYCDPPGSGWRDCTTCGGDGQMYCTSCSGLGNGTCTNCSDGTITCGYCGGEGKLDDHSDTVIGDIHANGDVKFTGSSDAHGTVSATGNITGNAGQNATLIDGAESLLPPDLEAMDYPNIADFVITDETTGWGNWGGGGQRMSESDPRHIFVKSHRTDTGLGVTDNINYYFMDPYTTNVTDRVEPGSPTYGRSQNRITVSSAGNHKLYYIEGNVWLEPWTFSSMLMSQSDGSGTQITIVVKGSVFMCDAFYYENPDKDAVLFIAMTDGESFKDLDGDNQYDLGEPIINDDGDGVYEGPTEGSGNIYYGDPNTGPVGTMQAFMYAENDFQDHCLDQDGKPLDFKIKGCMSAGNHIDINRDHGGQHARMEIDFDPRIRDGVVDLKGIPMEQSDAGTKFKILSWRMISADDNQ